MIDGEEENEIRFRDRLRPLISCPGHRGEDDGTFWKLLLYPFQKRDGTEYLSNGCGMEPDRFFLGRELAEIPSAESTPFEIPLGRGSGRGNREQRG
jgi:hypothetical protein